MPSKSMREEKRLRLFAAATFGKWAAIADSSTSADGVSGGLSLAGISAYLKSNPSDCKSYGRHDSHPIPSLRAHFRCFLSK
jgi:hypothetical protein